MSSNGKRYDHARILQLDRLNFTASEIAQEVGCTTRTVVRVRHTAGLTVASLRAPVTPERLAAARALLEDGASITEVCKTLHMDHHTITRHLPGYGYTPQQSAELSAMVRRLKRLDPRTALRNPQKENS